MDSIGSSFNESIKNNGVLSQVKTAYIAPPSPTLEINQDMELMSASGNAIYRLGFGGSPLPPCGELVKAYSENLWSTSYPPIQGLYECRESIASFYQSQFSLDFQPEGIFVFPGSKEAIFQILSILEGPLLLPAPSWVSYAPQARMTGKEVHWIETKQENAYKLTPTALQATSQKLSKGQKILILNSPNNPVGHVYTEIELRSLAEVCKEENILVIFDAIYAHPRDFDAQVFKSMYEFYPEGCFFTGGLSKIFSCGGWRFGFVVLPQSDSSRLASALTYKMSETISGVNLPLQHAAIKAYQCNEVVETYLNNVNRIYGFVTNYMRDRLIEMGLSCPKPSGAFYVFPSFDNFKNQLLEKQIHNSVDLAKFLKSMGIFVLPGLNFGLSKEELAIRISCTDFDGNDVFNELQDRTLEQISLKKFFPKIEGACDQLNSFLQSL